MGDQLVKDLWMPQNVSVNVAQPVIQANNCELKPALISMVQHSQFSGSALNDPHEHINQFMEYCNTVKMNRVPADTIKLHLFPFSLRDGAKLWLNSLPLVQKSNWDSLQQSFFEKYFSPLKAAEYRAKIHSFEQCSDESLHDAWNRYQSFLRMCPHHGLERWLVLQTFYKGLTPSTRTYIDSSAGGGGIMNKTLNEAFTLIENMASHDVQWSSERSSAPLKPGMHHISSSDALAAQMEIMNKNMSHMLSSIKSVGSVAFSSIVQPAPAQICIICGVPGHGHDGECVGISVAESSAQSVSEVNYAQSQGPYSHNYNPRWIQHPTLSYKNNMPAQSSFSSSVSHLAQSQPQYPPRQDGNTTIEKLLENGRPPTPNFISRKDFTNHQRATSSLQRLGDEDRQHQHLGDLPART